MIRLRITFCVCVSGVVLLTVGYGVAVFALPVADDPLVRMPGTQPGTVTLEDPGRCFNCHAGYNTQVEPGFNWQGSMMSQAARDFMFYSCMVVAGQDSNWAIGTPNAMDLCVRCHFPGGWLAGRSDPPNASLMTRGDFDGVHCDMCHKMYDPFFADTFAGIREGNDWLSYWDETNASATKSSVAATTTRAQDKTQATTTRFFNGNLFYGADDRPISAQYTENASGQFYVAATAPKRASFADAEATHQMLYSRYHKSKYFCASCHDVSNPALANLAFIGTSPGGGTTVLPSENASAFSYFHVERTFSEFMLSDYGLQGGAPGIGPFAPDVFTTSTPDNYISRCQDCHMRDTVGPGCNKQKALVRPNESVEHPRSGQPLHDMTGGNAWVPAVLASTVVGSPNYNAVNASLLKQGPNVLTLDLTQGQGINAQALLAGAERAKQQLALAATIENVQYTPGTGALSFRIQNQTGHKLISGFPEGRRMFLNIKAYSGELLVYEVNPYDTVIGTLKGLERGSSPDLGDNEAYIDELIYEAAMKSTLTGEDKTFHFVLADGRYKDNRIPPRGFRIAEADSRVSTPVWHGIEAPDYFTASEYAGGYDDVSLVLPPGADHVEIGLYYQTTSREYIEFLRDQIKGTGTLTLPPEAYIVQTDPFFSKLKAWGDTIWLLWENNKDLPGAAPILMASAGLPPCEAPEPTLLTATPGETEIHMTWSDEHSSDPNVIGYAVYYDQAGKAQLVDGNIGLATAFTDTGLTAGQTYCYSVSALYAECESQASNALCASLAYTPTVLGVTSSLPDGYYTTGQVIPIEVIFSEDVMYDPGTGDAQLHLETGDTDRYASYSSGSGTDALTFEYTVQAGDTSTNLDYTSAEALTLTGTASIRNMMGADVTLTLPEPGLPQSLGGNTELVIDTTPPNVLEILPSTTGPTNADSIDFVVLFDEPVHNFNDGADILVNHSGTNNTGVAIDGSGDLYTVTIEGITGDGSFTIAVNLSSDVQDLAGNTLTSSVTSDAVLIDNTPPTIVILGPQPSQTATGPVEYIVVYEGEEIVSLSTDDITLDLTGDVTASVSVTPVFGSNWEVHLFNITGTGTVGFSIAPGTALDAAGNQAPGVTSDPVQVVTNMPLVIWPAILLLIASGAAMAYRRRKSR